MKILILSIFFAVLIFASVSNHQKPDEESKGVGYFNTKGTGVGADADAYVGTIIKSLDRRKRKGGEKLDGVNNIKANQVKSDVKSKTIQEGETK